MDASTDDKWASPWSNDGSRAMQLSLVRSKAAVDQLDAEEKSKMASPFHPAFVHQIFGESEVIYGYRKLNIELKFTSGSLATYLSVDYAKKMPSQPGNEPDDVEGKLYNILPADYLKNAETFEQKLAEDEKSFKPVGKKIGAYAKKRTAPAAQAESNGKGKEAAQDEDEDGEDDGWDDCEPDDPEAEVVYEGWAAQITTPGFRDLHRRMQVFSLFYIEIASYLEEDDPKWEFVVLYEKRKNPQGPDGWSYHFMGYTSLYQFLYFPDKTRLRLAQLVILPPFQKQGHGHHLYSMVYLWCLTREDVAEFCVEDPNESFDEMRDKADLQTILAQPALGELLQRLPLDKQLLSEIRLALKLDKRQFARLIEMAVLLKLGLNEAPNDKHFRLLVKERLYRHNQDALKELEQAERKLKLQEAFDSVIEGYKKTLVDLVGGELGEGEDEDEQEALGAIAEEEE